MEMRMNQTKNISSKWIILAVVIVSILSSTSKGVVNAFVVPTRTTVQTATKSTHGRNENKWSNNHQSMTRLYSSYTPPENIQYTSKREAPYPKIGDLVRFYDVDGGKADGQVLVGKISLIQKVLKSEKDTSTNDEWLVEITELEDVGDGYYADYPSRKRKSKRTLRNLQYIAPLAASFVRAEDAYKVPRDMSVSPPVPKPSHPSYKIEGYEGPRSEPINEDVVMEDFEKYGQLKVELIKNAAIAGLAGTVITELAKGLEDAIIYAAGAAAGVGYLYFLSIKTDTVGGNDAKMGSNISNVRFVLPVLVLVAIALRNASLGDANPVVVQQGASAAGFMTTVSKEQFGAAMLGFLTYRLPLFLSQLSPVIKESAGGLLPGSAGVAMQMAQKAKEKSAAAASASPTPFGENLVPVLLICGPPGTGKTSLITKLIQEDKEQRFVLPKLVDRVADGASFERLENRGEFLQLDSSGRLGLTKEAILNAAPSTTTASTAEDDDASSSTTKQVVVVDANVDLAKKLVSSLSGARLVGVWIGLDSLDKFESRLNIQLESGDLVIPADETKESFMRAKIREIVQDIEYGVVSGIFEFTILNDEFDESLSKLKNAAEYCFK
mmetsp:Transcript_18561/g.27388  ORF Transcript_18561/g.27388 Transcript_18561/m.27388 type:complete len:609 (-) Transcript_18561:300-2126(-)